MNELTAILKNNLPFRRQLRAFKRAIVPYRSNPKNDEGLVGAALRIVDALASSGANLAGCTVVEIGTGWIPILPLVLRMAGVKDVISVDQDKLMDRATFSYAVEFIHAQFCRLQERIGISVPFDMRRLPCHSENSLSEVCRSAGITYLAPFDFMDLAPNTADFFVSRTVLEHITEDILIRIFEHAALVLKPGGMMCHMIDMSDHFEHKDNSLSRVDMLRYSDLEWRARTRDPQDYQNRLRRFDFVRILRETGWEIVSMTGDPNPKALEDLKTMQIMPRYASVPHEELAILTSLIVARRLSQSAIPKKISL